MEFKRIRLDIINLQTLMTSIHKSILSIINRRINISLLTMIQSQTLTQSRQVQLDLVAKPSKAETKFHRLGGLSRAQSLKEPIKTSQQPVNFKPTSQQVVFTFSSTNPFYHMHQALHLQPVKTQPTQKCFQDVIREVYEMKQICQRLLTPQNEENQHEYKKTLIMDLQKLQTNRVELENAQKEFHESQISIKESLPEDWNSCLHGSCEQINSILEKALGKLEELQKSTQTLEKVLSEEKISKQLAEHDNSQLRQDISRIDEQKCKEIKKLRQEIDRLRWQKENHSIHVPIHEIGRVPLENLSLKSIKQVNSKQRPVLVDVEFVSNLNESKLVSVPPKSQQTVQNPMKKLKHVVYL